MLPVSDGERSKAGADLRVAGSTDERCLFQMVSGLKLELTSVSQGLQTLYSRTEQTEELQETVAELKKNMSLEGNSRLLATLLDEQGKKVGG